MGSKTSQQTCISIHSDVDFLADINGKELGWMSVPFSGILCSTRLTYGAHGMFFVVLVVICYHHSRRRVKQR